MIQSRLAIPLRGDARGMVDEPRTIYRVPYLEQVTIILLLCQATLAEFQGAGTTVPSSHWKCFKCRE